MKKFALILLVCCFIGSLTIMILSAIKNNLYAFYGWLCAGVLCILEIFEIGKEK